MSETIKRLRIAAGKTRAEVSADLDISERHLHRLEQQAELPRRWCLAFAAYYSVEPEEIAGCAEAATS